MPTHSNLWSLEAGWFELGAVMDGRIRTGCAAQMGIVTMCRNAVPKAIPVLFGPVNRCGHRTSSVSSQSVPLDEFVEAPICGDSWIVGSGSHHHMRRSRRPDL